MQVFDAIPETFIPNIKNPCFFYRGTSPPGLRCLPYFYLIGMQKCGSTDLWEKINAHHEIQRIEKEPHWWARYRVRELPADYGINMTTPLSLSWYLDVMSYQIVPRLMTMPDTADWLVVFDAIPETFIPNIKNPCFFYRGTSPPGLRCLPYFYLIGMQKCGSTDLWEKINAHHEIQRIEKEPHWWARYRVRELPADYGINMTTPLSLSWYLDVMSYQIVPRLMTMPDTADWLVVGDGSTSTLWDNKWQQVSDQQIDGPDYVIADVIKEVQPKAKFIVVFRDPTERVYSDYLFFGNEGDNFISKLHFNRIVEEGIKTYHQCMHNMTKRACTFRHGTQSSRLLLGNYAVFLRDWLRIFSRDQILVVRLEDWQQRCTTVLKEIYRFLELSPLRRTELAFICSGERIRVNTQMKKHMGDMLVETRTLLNNFYAPMNAELSRLLNDTRFLWNDVAH
eukprot:XP_011675249.1 PREDICTED: carbohydrate sulfotransferase 15 [Strongylocentrotus purpuratus]